MPRAGRKLTRKALSGLYADIPPSRRRALFRKYAELSEQCVDEAANNDRMSARAKSETLRNAVQSFVMLGDIAAKALDNHEQAARIMAAITTPEAHRRIIVEFVAEDSQSTPDEAVNNTAERDSGSGNIEPTKGSSQS